MKPFKNFCIVPFIFLSVTVSVTGVEDWAIFISNLINIEHILQSTADWVIPHNKLTEANLAQGKPTAQQSTKADEEYFFSTETFISNNAVDGDEETSAVTQGNPLDWWMVDLKEYFYVYQLRIIHDYENKSARPDYHVYRYNVYRDNDVMPLPPHEIKHVWEEIGQDNKQETDASTFYYIPSLITRYIAVTRRYGGIISLKEMEVYGFPPVRADISLTDGAEQQISDQYTIIDLGQDLKMEKIVIHGTGLTRIVDIRVVSEHYHNQDVANWPLCKPSIEYVSTNQMILNCQQQAFSRYVGVRLPGTESIEVYGFYPLRLAANQLEFNETKLTNIARARLSEGTWLKVTLDHASYLIHVTLHRDQPHEENFNDALHDVFIIITNVTDLIEDLQGDGILQRSCVFIQRPLFNAVEHFKCTDPIHFGEEVYIVSQREHLLPWHSIELFGVDYNPEIMQHTHILDHSDLLPSLAPTALPVFDGQTTPKTTTITTSRPQTTPQPTSSTELPSQSAVLPSTVAPKPKSVIISGALIGIIGVIAIVTGLAVFMKTKKRGVHPVIVPSTQYSDPEDSLACANPGKSRKLQQVRNEDNTETKKKNLPGISSNSRTLGTGMINQSSRKPVTLGRFLPTKQETVTKPQAIHKKELAAKNEVLEKKDLRGSQLLSDSSNDSGSTTSS